MKVFMLGCANENGEVVSMQTFLDEDAAYEQMKKEYEAERKEHDYDNEEIGSNYAELSDVCVTEYSRLYRWHIYKEDIHATPSAILNALRNSMRDDIERRAEAIVPGYDSARKAVIDLRDEKFHKLSFANGDTLLRVEAFIGLIGLAVVVKCADGEERNGVVDFDAMDTDELLELHTIITNFQHPTRACNPFWFTDKEWHTVLMDILDQTEEEYDERIDNNPKNKK